MKIWGDIGVVFKYQRSRVNWKLKENRFLNSSKFPTIKV